MLKVFRDRTPLKVLRAVIRLVTVDVVDGRAAAGNRESGSHKAVDFLLFPLATVRNIANSANPSPAPKRNTKIAMHVEGASENPARASYAAKIARFVSRIFGDGSPLFHKGGYGDKTTLQQGVF